MNVNKLKGKIVENGLNVVALAEMTGIERSKLYRRLNNFEMFTVGEVSRIKDALNLTGEEATEIFFN